MVTAVGIDKCILIGFFEEGGYDDISIHNLNIQVQEMNFRLAGLMLQNYAFIIAIKFRHIGTQRF